MNDLPLDQTNRLNVIRAFINAGNRVRNGRYIVRRGPTPWGAFSFETHQYGMSILLPQFTLAVTGDMAVEIELVHKIDTEDLGGSTREDEVQDTVIESMIEDARELIVDAVYTRSDAGNDIGDVIGKPEVREIVSADWSIQGIRVNFDFKF